MMVTDEGWVQSVRRERGGRREGEVMLVKQGESEGSELKTCLPQTAAETSRPSSHAQR